MKSVVFNKRRNLNNMFWDNVGRRIRGIVLLLGHAEQKGLSNKVKSSYHRSAMILSCTVVEGMVYELVRKSTISNGNIVGNKTEHTEKHHISSGVFATSNHHCICEKIKKDRHINDRGVDFSELNNYLKNKKLVSAAEYKGLDWVRKERNKIHLQGLQGKDTGYTKVKINKTAEVFGFLIRKVNNI